MHRFIEILKSHPYAIGAGVLIGAAIIFLMTRSGTATGGTYSAPQQDNTLALAETNAQLVAQQDAIRMQGNLAALAVQENQDNNATAVNLATISAGVTTAQATQAYSLASQKETDTQNLSLLTMAGQNMLASQQQGYTASLAQQKEQDSFTQNMTNIALAGAKRVAANSPGNVASLQRVTAAATSNIAGGSLNGSSSTGSVSDNITKQIGAIATGSSSFWDQFFGSVAHLTGPVSSSPTATPSST